MRRDSLCLYWENRLKCYDIRHDFFDLNAGDLRHDAEILDRTFSDRAGHDGHIFLVHGDQRIIEKIILDIGVQKIVQLVWHIHHELLFRHFGHRNAADNDVVRRSDGNRRPFAANPILPPHRPYDICERVEGNYAAIFHGVIRKRRFDKTSNPSSLYICHLHRIGSDVYSQHFCSHSLYPDLKQKNVVSGQHPYSRCIKITKCTVS